MATGDSAAQDANRFIVLEGVRKSYPGAGAVISDFNLSISRGEFVTLLGPSGSGKSTLLMLLAGFEKPDAGAIVARGRNYVEMAPKDRNIGVVFQDYALFPHMTVAQNVAYPLRVRRMASAERRAAVERVLRLVQLEDLAHRRPAALSGGQRQRVALARALVFQPDFVLMDEPLSALDRRLRDHLQVELKHLHAKLGVTVVYVTHDQDEALTMSDRIVVLDRGRVQQVGTPEDVYARSANLFVADFIGESNRLDGCIVARRGEEATIRLAGGREMPCRPVGSLNVGDRATISVRPENVRLELEPAPEPEPDHGLPATLVEAIYYGDHARVVVSLPEGGPLTVRVPANGAAPAVEAGRPVRISWDASLARAFVC
ncbi:MAG: ABC transporter ATP-binding protein [Alphaproteobacteria bacterium]|nr:ABC transporter ATP-binding protein [Alphaproteobacteria bacterium]